MKHKVKEWLKRYLPPEIISVVATLVAASLTYKFTQSGIKTALVATWTDNLIYYGYILSRDVWKTRNMAQQNDKVYTLKSLVRNIRALFLEFGAAEIFDSFLVRPALMFYLPIMLGSLTWGILAGKLLSDVLFYIPAIIGYEISKRKLRDHS